MAKERNTGHVLSKGHVTSNWTRVGVESPLLHWAGYHGDAVYGVGYDRRLYTANQTADQTADQTTDQTADQTAEHTDYTLSTWGVLPSLEGVECAAVSDDGYVYVVLTSGDITRHKIEELKDTRGKRRSQLVYTPHYNVSQ